LKTSEASSAADAAVALQALDVVAATKGSGKGDRVRRIAFIAKDVPEMERREIEKDSVSSRKENCGFLSITRKKTAQSPTCGAILSASQGVEPGRQPTRRGRKANDTAAWLLGRQQ
jgi:hypothetical protein